MMEDKLAGMGYPPATGLWSCCRRGFAHFSERY